MQSFKKPVVAIDIDLTVVDTLTPWLIWLQRKGLHFPSEAFLCQQTENGNWLTHYDRMPEFAHINGFGNIEIGDLIKSHMEYWSNPKLYDFLKPIPSAVEKIHRMVKEIDAEIVWVSHCISGHKDSKVEFIKHYFPQDVFKWEFVDTRAKHRVNYDVLIDDNPSIMKACIEKNPRSKHIMFTGVFFEAMIENIPRFSSDFDSNVLVHEPISKLGKEIPAVHLLGDWSKLKTEDLLY